MRYLILAPCGTALCVMGGATKGAVGFAMVIVGGAIVGYIAGKAWVLKERVR